MMTQPHKFAIHICLCLCACIGMTTAFAAPHQSHKSIYQAAGDFVRAQAASIQSAQTTVVVGKLDSRLKLKRCSKPLQAFLPKGSRSLGRTTVGVRCKGTNSWSLNMPVTISVFKKVLVASHQLQKGSVLTVSDIKLTKTDVAKLQHGFFTSLNDGKGKKISRRISAGKVITPGMLKNPRLISRGQQISIVAQSGRMIVRMKGKALANGAVGDRIRVKNSKSGKKLEGVVTPSGEVKVDI